MILTSWRPCFPGDRLVADATIFPAGGGASNAAGQPNDLDVLLVGVRDARAAPLARDPRIDLGRDRIAPLTAAEAHHAPRTTALRPVAGAAAVVGQGHAAPGPAADALDGERREVARPRIVRRSARPRRVRGGA